MAMFVGVGGWLGGSWERIDGLLESLLLSLERPVFLFAMSLILSREPLEIRLGFKKIIGAMS